MLNRILLVLHRRWPRASSQEKAPPWTRDDVSWYSSSFELARGLEVIEHREAVDVVFVDTQPAFQRAEA